MLVPPLGDKKYVKRIGELFAALAEVEGYLVRNVVK